VFVLGGSVEVRGLTKKAVVAWTAGCTCRTFMNGARCVFLLQPDGETWAEPVN
jgi:hypothetical protein